MSLDVSLYIGKNRVFDSNITHNLTEMAEACGVYHACWHPELIHCKKAKHILPLLESGIRVLEADEEHYQKFNAPNGWGMYEHFLPWLKEYAKACKEFPEAKIDTSV